MRMDQPMLFIFVNTFKPHNRPILTFLRLFTQVYYYPKNHPYYGHLIEFRSNCYKAPGQAEILYSVYHEQDNDDVTIMKDEYKGYTKSIWIMIGKGECVNNMKRICEA